MIYFKDVRIIDSHQDKISDVIVESDKIRYVGYNRVYAFLSVNEFAKGDLQIIDGRERMILMPSLADVHTNTRYPGSGKEETLFTYSMAALKGGYTHALAMADTNPIPDRVTRLQNIIYDNRELNLIRLQQSCPMTIGMEGMELVSVTQLRDHTRFLYQEDAVASSETVKRIAYRKAGDLNFTIVHNHASDTDQLEKDLEMAQENQVQVHVTQVSTKETVDLLREVRKRGWEVTSDVTAHHLFKSNFTFPIAPPFGKEEDRQALIEGIRDGTITMISSGHSPLRRQESGRMPGISSVEHNLDIAYLLFEEEGIPLTELSRLMSYEPKKLLGAPVNLIEEGQVADLILIDTGDFQLNKFKMVSLGHNTPFHGYLSHTRVQSTFAKGVKLYDYGRS